MGIKLDRKKILLIIVILFVLFVVAFRCNIADFIHVFVKGYTGQTESKPWISNFLCPK